MEVHFLSFVTSQSYNLTLPHTTSHYLTLPHGSHYLTLPHVTSHYLTLPHITSHYLILPHITSHYLILPHITVISVTEHHTRLGETEGTVTSDEKGYIKVAENGTVDMETGHFVIQNPTFRES